MTTAIALETTEKQPWLTMKTPKRQSTGGHGDYNSNGDSKGNKDSNGKTKQQC